MLDETKQRYVRGVGLALVAVYSLLWFTSPTFFYTAIGSILLPIGMCMSIDSCNPSVHRYAGIAFLTISALFSVSASTTHLVFGAIGAAFFSLGSMLLIDSSHEMRNGVGLVLVSWGVLLRLDPGPSMSSDPSGPELALMLGAILVALGSILGGPLSNARALATGGLVLLTLRWIDCDYMLCWWKFGVWLALLNEGHPGYVRKFFRLATLPVQALLIPTVFLGEAAHSRSAGRVKEESMSLARQGGEGRFKKFRKLIRLGDLRTAAVRRVDRFLFPESTFHQILKKHERMLGPLRRIGAAAVYGMVQICMALFDILWDPVFQETAPRLYTWMNSSVYTALDATEPSIRVLHLEPGVGVDTLKGSLVNESVLTARFEALSYTWGRAYVLRRRIQINGRTLWITDSVARALGDLRLPDETRALWIDQICVNQADNEEKNDQVGNKMRLVFQNAQRVIIWLGTPPPRLSEAFDGLQAALISQSKDGMLGNIDKTQLWSTIAKSNTTWENVLRRKWWSRVWVIQEALLNRNTVIRSGEHELAWDSLTEIAGIPNTICNVDSATRKFLSFSQEFKTGATADLDVIDLSIRFSNSDSSKEADRLYAFYGLSSELKPPELQVNYDRAIMWIFADHTAHHIKRMRSLDTLALAERYPFWVPSWSINFNFQIGWHSLDVFAELWNSNLLRTHRALSDISAAYSASGNRSASYVEYYPEKLRLTLRGWYVDTVKDVACHLRETRFDTGIVSWEDFARCYSLDWRAPVDEMNSERGSIISQRWANSTEKSDFIRLLLGDIYYDDLRDEWYDRVFHEQPLSRKAKYSRASTDFFDTFLDVCLNRRLFVTAKGSFGIGPADAKPGDQVWVLEGSRVPYILRAEKKDNKQASVDEMQATDPDMLLRFIGEAVVKGIMYATEESLQAEEEVGRIEVCKMTLT